MKKVEDFGVRKPADFRDKLLPQGAWARCTRCSRQRKASTGGATNSETQQEQWKSLLWRWRLVCLHEVH